MTCISYGNGVTVCLASDKFLRKVIRRCPTCECKTEMVDRHEAWYGVTTYCCRCGDEWQDGELSPRPLERGWRERRVAYYRGLWDRATHGRPPSMYELYPDLAEDGAA